MQVLGRRNTRLSSFKFTEQLDLVPSVSINALVVIEGPIPGLSAIRN